MPKSIDALPQSGRWQLYVHKLRAWIPGDDEQPVRPYLMLVVSTDDGAFLACEPGAVSYTHLTLPTIYSV